MQRLHQLNLNWVEIQAGPPLKAALLELAASYRYGRYFANPGVGKRLDVGASFAYKRPVPRLTSITPVAPLSQPIDKKCKSSKPQFMSGPDILTPQEIASYLYDAPIIDRTTPNTL